MRVLCVIGTRPEAIKMAPVVSALRLTPGVEVLVCSTGQHRQLLEPLWPVLDLVPDFRFAAMRPRQTPDRLAARLLVALGGLLTRTRPDWLLAAGDTTTVLAAGVAAAHHRVRFGHVEAGLRSGRKEEPFPEELHRRIAGVVADLHFAPTATARAHLRRENVPASTIIVTGNPVVDTLQRFAVAPVPARARRLTADTDDGTRLVVATFHRRENLGSPLHDICTALSRIARHYRGLVRILCPVHPNPAVRRAVRAALGHTPHVQLCAPLPYPVMVAVLQRAHLVLTDSGGLQEECPALGIPVLVLRRTTERPEAVRAGRARVIGTTPAAIVAWTRRLLDRPAAHRAMARVFTGYGDGHAGARIAAALVRHHRRFPPDSPR